jgi:hypothetical protein
LNLQGKAGPAYKAAVRALMSRVGVSSLPAGLRPLVADYGRLYLELDRLTADLEAARSRGDATEAREIRRDLWQEREALRRLEDRIAELAPRASGLTIAAQVAAIHAAKETA